MNRRRVNDRMFYGHKWWFVVAVLVAAILVMLVISGCADREPQSLQDQIEEIERLATIRKQIQKENALERVIRKATM